jgi:hypothetical protein
MPIITNGPSTYTPGCDAISDIGLIPQYGTLGIQFGFQQLCGFEARAAHDLRTRVSRPDSTPAG